MTLTAKMQANVLNALDELITEAGGAAQLTTPPGYSHLGLSILDAVYSLRSNYDSVVVPALKRYCTAVDLDWNDLEGVSPEHGAQALVDHLGSWSDTRRTETLTAHVAPGTTTRKHHLCVQVAQVLLSSGVDKHHELGPALAAHPQLEWEVRELSGIGPAAWRYILNLSRVEKVKPDTMIVRWLAKVTGKSVGQADAALLLESAATTLMRSNPELTVRKVDHLVWRFQSGRTLASNT